MKQNWLEDLLPLLRHPSRYLGSEVNAVRKGSEGIAVRVALAFPDLYEVGMSYLGQQILYYILNKRKDVAAERVFAPGADLEQALRRCNQPLCSLETKRPLGLFDMIGFSLLYELNFTNILNILDLSGVPLRTQDRQQGDPLVVAGGPCAFNPEPVAEFFDAMVIGDGEELIVQLIDTYIAWKDSGSSRETLLRTWSQLPGVYVPSFFEVSWTSGGVQRLRPRFSDYTRVRKALVTDLNRTAFPDRPVVAYGKPIHDRLNLEVCRGCSRGCRFCQAGMIYRPVRERDPVDLLGLARESLRRTGYEDVSLLSLSTGDYGPLEGVIKRLMQWCEPEKIAVSLPSLRVGTLSESMMSEIRRVRKTGFTIAPEAGSQRLRDVINKNITEQDLEETLVNAFRLGWRQVKLYFMIGLPTETARDIDEIVRLVGRLRQLRVPRAGRADIAVSVSTFIPKPHTPFQWCRQLSLEESKETIFRLRDALRGKGLRFKWQQPQMSLIEGLWARGDRRLGALLVRAYEMGCRLDGWSDHFRFERWQAAMQACDLDLASFLRARDISEPLPWDHVDCGVSRTFLEKEWKKAQQARTTEDCRQGQCLQCGVCDFKSVAPVTFGVMDNDSAGRDAGRPLSDTGFERFKISYEKLGPARFFSHLELVKILTRAFRRAGIPLRFSQGFHPAPKMSFEEALPVGLQSEQETFLVDVASKGVVPAALIESVNRELPDGLRLTQCRVMPKRAKMSRVAACGYLVLLQDEIFCHDRLDSFRKSLTWPMKKTNKKGKQKILDLKRVVRDLEISGPGKVRMVLDEVAGNHVGPTEALQSIFRLGERSLKLATIVKQPLA
ncbi:MAG: TIGR03960 family B12-binding radical SAM protein [Deltaproteobacteria bacterium]|nr:TIGR03960 family B12-binding radical SAM protein [Deltaproteobacteria bacterium]